MKIVAVFSLSCRGLLDFVYGPSKGKGSSENVLFNKLLPRFNSSDLLIFDRYFTGYFNLAMLINKGIDFVSKQHHKRTESDVVKRISKRERLIRLTRPCRRKGSWWTDDSQVFESAPKTIILRELDIIVAIKGFRVKKFTIITNLIDSKDISFDEIQQLYRARWCVELDLRDIKTSMKMSILSTKSPAMLEKEPYIHFMAYNLVILLILQSAKYRDISPREVSFKAAMQLYRAARLAGGKINLETILTLIYQAGTHTVGKRPNRYEPRAIKTRRQRYPILRVSRDKGRKACLN